MLYYFFSALTIYFNQRVYIAKMIDIIKSFTKQTATAYRYHAWLFHCEHDYFKHLYSNPSWYV
jgi:hypothetical protein